MKTLSVKVTPKEYKWRKIKKKLLIGLGIVFAFLFFMHWLTENFGPAGGIRYFVTAEGSGAITLLDISQNMDFGCFDDIHSAVIGYFQSGIPQEIVIFEEPPHTLAIFPGNITGFMERPVFSIIYLYFFREQADDTLCLTHRLFQGMETFAVDRRGNWYNEDRIARDIMMASVHEPITSHVNAGNPIYYGVGVGSPPTYMSILGYEPDNIIAFEYRGVSYFFWYYRTAEHFSELFHENIDIHYFYLGEIIELFDIRVIE